MPARSCRVSFTDREKQLCSNSKLYRSHIPVIARLIRNRIGFLKTRPELMKAFTGIGLRRRPREFATREAEA